MTDEEKAEEILQTKGSMTFCAKGCGYTEKVKELITIGLSEGRKEKCLEQNKDGTIRPCEVMKENAELKEQIEKLKNNYKKQRNRRIDELQKENAELKEQLKNNPYVQILQNEKSEMAEDFAKQIEKMKVIEKENSIFKSIISTILDKDDICYICQMKGQVLPECMCMENSECLKNNIICGNSLEIMKKWEQKDL